MAYLGQSLQEACDSVIHQSIGGMMGSTGGMVAVDVRGHVAMPFHCEGMYRAFVDGRGRRLVAIYDEE
jgi:isoaspartyl peptidase/L-asparaginase-like protein (Ntn-hydrolase superfamily)